MNFISAMSVCIRAGSQKLLQEQFTFLDTDLGVEKTKEDSFLHMGDKVVERKTIILGVSKAATQMSC